jgi:hypothetical protein
VEAKIFGAVHKGMPQQVTMALSFVTLSNLRLCTLTPQVNFVNCIQ